MKYVAKYRNVLQSPAINLYWWQQCLGRLRLYTRRNYYSVLPRVVYFPKIKEALVWIAQCKEGQ